MLGGGWSICLAASSALSRQENPYQSNRHDSEECKSMIQKSHCFDDPFRPLIFLGYVSVSSFNFPKNLSTCNDARCSPNKEFKNTLNSMLRQSLNEYHPIFPIMQERVMISIMRSIFIFSEKLSTLSCFWLHLTERRRAPKAVTMLARN